MAAVGAAGHGGPRVPAGREVLPAQAAAGAGGARVPVPQLRAGAAADRARQRGPRELQAGQPARDPTAEYSAANQTCGLIVR